MFSFLLLNSILFEDKDGAMDTDRHRLVATAVLNGWDINEYGLNVVFSKNEELMAVAFTSSGELIFASYDSWLSHRFDCEPASWSWPRGLWLDCCLPVMLGLRP